VLAIAGLWTVENDVDRMENDCLSSIVEVLAIAGLWTVENDVDRMENGCLSSRVVALAIVGPWIDRSSEMRRSESDFCHHFVTLIVRDQSASGGLSQQRMLVGLQVLALVLHHYVSPDAPAFQAFEAFEPKKRKT
jgi:hypothetical protein